MRKKKSLKKRVSALEKTVQGRKQCVSYVVIKCTNRNAYDLIIKNYHEWNTGYGIGRH